jgi:hypothetical protein
VDDELYEDNKERDGQPDLSKVVKLDRDEIIEQLYNLDLQDLRRVAWEALLIADGPDHIFKGPNEDTEKTFAGETSAIQVNMDELQFSPTHGTVFTVWAAEGHK